MVIDNSTETSTTQDDARLLEAGSPAATDTRIEAGVGQIRATAEDAIEGGFVRASESFLLQTTALSLETPSPEGFPLSGGVERLEPAIVAMVEDLRTLGADAVRAGSLIPLTPDTFILNSPSQDGGFPLEPRLLFGSGEDLGLLREAYS